MDPIPGTRAGRSGRPVPLGNPTATPALPEVVDTAAYAPSMAPGTGLSAALRRRGRGQAPAETLAWAAVAAWTAWWAHDRAHPSGISWHYFRDGAHALFGGSGLHVYAQHPTLQIGPLAFVVAGAVDLLAGAHALGVAQLVAMTGLPVVLGLLASLLPSAGRPWRVLLGGLVLAPAWTVVAVRWVHLDDALALTLVTVGLWGVRRGRGHPALAGVALAGACAAKPWAVIALPLLLVLPPRSRGRAVTYAVVGTAVAWLPFLMADPGTLSALHPPVRVADSSVMWWLGYHGTYLPAWDRLAQLVIAPLVALLAVWRRSWPGALLAGVAVRLVLDPQDIAYYAAGAVVGALVLDLFGRRSRVPWTAVVTAVALWQPFVIDFARRFELSSGVSQWWYRNPGSVAAVHVVWASLAVLAAFWPTTARVADAGAGRRARR